MDDYDDDRNDRSKPWEIRLWLHGAQINEATFDETLTYNKLFYFGMGGEFLLTKSRIGFKFQGSVSFPELSAGNTHINEEDIQYVFWQGHIAMTYHLSSPEGTDLFLQAGFGATGGVKRLDVSDQYFNSNGDLITEEVGLSIFPMIGAGVNVFLSEQFFIGGETRLLLAQITPAGEDRELKTFSASRLQFDVKVGLTF